mmetsp:Transcript_35782/g.98633  ORF Transcript_35782/g.98633 Transcript_35782/m.98633 type:complete len:272 (-) Transcript_35782:482-1297(-)
MLSGLRSAWTIRFRWMCRTLNMREPKTSAASENVRRPCCSHARRVNLASVATVGPPSGGWPMSSISIKTTTHCGGCHWAAPATNAEEPWPSGRWSLGRSSSCGIGAAAAALLDEAAGATDGSEASSQTNPQLSPSGDINEPLNVRDILIPSSKSQAPLKAPPKASPPKAAAPAPPPAVDSQKRRDCTSARVSPSASTSSLSAACSPLAARPSRQSSSPDGIALFDEACGDGLPHRPPGTTAAALDADEKPRLQNSRISPGKCSGSSNQYFS